jgi:hypothetical protein
VNLVEDNGVEAQDEHFLPPPNRWANREGEFNDPIIPKELCGSGSTRLGGPLGVSRVLLQQLETLRDWVHPFLNGDGQIANYAHDSSSTWTTPE